MILFRHRWQRAAGWLLLFGLMLFLALNKHSRAGRFNYHSEIWSDKAGYYIYLPLLFEYSMDVGEIRDTSLVSGTGAGFVIDSTRNTLQTKYPYGVALAQLPFYLLANVLAPPGEDPPGFSEWHHRMVNGAAVCYLLFGLFFLSRFLRAYFRSRIVFLTLTALLLGTNLYYYSVFETGMSHVYSFGVFSFFLWFLKHTRFLERGKTTDFLVFGLLCGWVIILRPINLLFLLIYFFLDHSGKENLLSRCKRLLRPAHLVIVAGAAFLVILPQLLYWKYAFGSWLSYSYGDEGFNWPHPQWLKVLFSPNNGLFLYLPLFLLLLVFMVRMWLMKVPNGRLLLTAFLLLTYIFSCWWEWGFGCAFGGRCYVEYLSLFSLALAYGFDWLAKQRLFVRAVGFVLVLCCVIYAFKMMYSYTGCFQGHKNWDWQAYRTWVMEPMH